MRCGPQDIRRVEKVLKDDAVWPYCTDDGTPPKSKIDVKNLLENKNIIILMPNDGMAVVLYPLNTIAYSIHFNTLREYRGKRAYEAVPDVLDYVFEKTPCRKLVTYVPAIFPNVIHFYLRIGMKIEGLLQQSILKDGNLVDQAILGMTKEQYRCHG